MRDDFWDFNMRETIENDVHRERKLGSWTEVGDKSRQMVILTGHLHAAVNWPLATRRDVMVSWPEVDEVDDVRYVTASVADRAPRQHDVTMCVHHWLKVTWFWRLCKHTAKK